MRKQEHIVDRIEHKSLAANAGIREGDLIVSINGEEIEDIFDYQYLVQAESLDILVQHSDESEEMVHIDKYEDDDLGIQFKEGLMDNYRSCTNQCIFCFIDQMPPGMRDTLYFKDDDARLSFLQGNYITLTNMSEHDIDRIIKYRLSPINISFHTMNPELRCKMLHNRFAGESLKKADRLVEAGITINGQIVLCKGINDGEELEYSLSKLYEYLPVLQSLSVVPVGLTKYRDGLYPLETYNSKESGEVIDIIERWQKKAYKEYGTHFVHASDEWYIVAGRELPEEERYDGYLQIENGVGMVRSMLEEYREAMEASRNHFFHSGIIGALRRKTLVKEKVTVITGRLVYPIILQMARECEELFPMKKIQVVAVRNDFFGEEITVTGLLTGQDILKTLKGLEDIGDRIVIPENVLRADTEVLLDDYTLDDLRGALHKRIGIVKSNGQDTLRAFLGL